MQPSSTTTSIANPDSDRPISFLDMLYEDGPPFPVETSSLREPAEGASSFLDMLHEDGPPFPNSRTEMNFPQEPKEEARRLRKGKWRATESADEQAEEDDGYLALEGKGVSASPSVVGSGSVSSPSAIDASSSQNDIGPPLSNNAAPPAFALSPNQAFQHYVPPAVPPEYAQWTPLHFKILCYSINCIKQHRHLNPCTYPQWEQMISAFMNGVLLHLHTRVAKKYEPRRFDFTPLWENKLAIPVDLLMDREIFITVNDLNCPAFHRDPTLASSTSESRIFRYYLVRRSDYETASNPRFLSDLPTIRQVFPQQVPFTPISEDHHTSEPPIDGPLPPASEPTFKDPLAADARRVHKDALHQQSCNGDFYLTNYDLDQRSPLLDWQGQPLPQVGLDSIQGEPQVASASSESGSSQSVATSSNDSSVLSTGTDPSPIASSSPRATIRVPSTTGVKRARDDPTSPDADGFSCQWQNCQGSHESTDALLSHIINDHKPLTRRKAEKMEIPVEFHCRWDGCRNNSGVGYADWSSLKKHLRRTHLGMSTYEKKTSSGGSVAH